eukprot:scaffold105885_cov48-Phaeocystis_antarctica.AAC.3
MRMRGPATLRRPRAPSVGQNHRHRWIARGWEAYSSEPAAVAATNHWSATARSRRACSDCYARRYTESAHKPLNY